MRMQLKQQEKEINSSQMAKLWMIFKFALTIEYLASKLCCYRVRNTIFLPLSPSTNETNVEGH